MTLTKHDIERSKTKPEIPWVDPQNLPRQMRDLPQWVLWRWQWQDGDDGKPGKWNKVLRQPQPRGTSPAKSNDPWTWGAFDGGDEDGGGVCGHYLTHDCWRPGAYGLGFVLSADDPFTVIDLDDCRDRDTGGLTAEALATVERFATYAEVSPSGTGIKLYLRGKKPGDRCRIKDHPDIEVYDRLRFVAMTGRRLPGCPTEPQNRQLELETYYRELFPEPEHPAAPARPAVPPLNPHNLSDSEIIDRAKAAANGAKFSRLWDGDTSGYPSRSEADQALAGLLAFWVGPDPGRIISLMWMSGLRANKKWYREDYLPRTVGRALTGRSSFYGDLYRPFEGGCARRSKEESRIENAAHTPPAHQAVAEPEQLPVGMLPGLNPPPPACACRRGAASLLRHQEQPERHRAVRHACDCWHCAVCRERLAYDWAGHYAACVAQAAAGGRTLVAVESTADRFARLRLQLHRRNAEWCALEVGPGLLLVLAALPGGADPPAGAESIDAARAVEKLVEWAKVVRTWPEPFGKQRKTRPARNSRGWAKIENRRSGMWQQVAVVPAIDPTPILDVLQAHGVHAAEIDRSPALGPSFCWGFECRMDPETAARVIPALAALDDLPAPPPPGGRRYAEDEPGWTPFEDGPMPC